MNHETANQPQTIVATVAMHGAKADEDRRAIIETPEEVIRGLSMVMKATGASRGIVAVPRNRTDLYRRVARAIDGDGPYSEGAAIRLVRGNEGDEKNGDGPYLMRASTLVAIARAVERALASRGSDERVAHAVVSPVGPDYRWLVEQSGGTIHAPYRVMVESG